MAESSMTAKTSSKQLQRSDTIKRLEEMENRMTFMSGFFGDVIDNLSPHQNKQV